MVSEQIIRVEIEHFSRGTSAAETSTNRSDLTPTQLT